MFSACYVFRSRGVFFFLKVKIDHLKERVVCLFVFSEEKHTKKKKNSIGFSLRKHSGVVTTCKYMHF